MKRELRNFGKHTGCDYVRLEEVLHPRIRSRVNTVQKRIRFQTNTLKETYLTSSDSVEPVAEPAPISARHMADVSHHVIKNLPRRPVSSQQRRR